MEKNPRLKDAVILGPAKAPVHPFLKLDVAAPHDDMVFSISGADDPWRRKVGQRADDGHAALCDRAIPVRVELLPEVV